LALFELSQDAEIFEVLWPTGSLLHPNEILE